ncbi:DUF5797 family protein [Halococcus saccharolyticus]|uniref:Uncharacterized protein n=1 Tax=Halococcus saccharolyticus DSM 5350 TaxID=1227455 RepID=M0MES9_9EURY|nr:DUF5797 family protein [Halococcus saccharolyticus]EMA44231.1 hypothetical protein C449_11913 [Halococcus saccharolyticus DSM 5350]
MGLSDEATARLEDVVALQPTKNAELAERWGMDGGSEVHQYLESELADHYYRDENSLIRATADAATLVGEEPNEDGPRTVRVPALQHRAFGVVADHDERAESVVSVLHKLRDDAADVGGNGGTTDDDDLTADDVRSALRGLERRGVVEVIQRTVPTFRLAVERDAVSIEPIDDE